SWGPDRLGLKNPNPDFLRQPIARAGGEPAHTVMVGDSPIDIATARAAAVPVIAVDYGYTESPVSELRPDRVIAGLGELPSAVFDLLDVGSSLAAEQRSSGLYLVAATLGAS